MHLGFDLNLIARHPDRVEVSVSLHPQGTAVSVDGVAVQLFGRAGEALSTRLLLPIAGTLTQPMLTTIELRGHHGHVPQGAKITGTAWQGPHQIEAVTDADFGPNLGEHMHGDRSLWPQSCAKLADLSDAERCTLAARFPWIQCWQRPLSVEEQDGVLEGEVPVDGDEVAAFAAELGIGEEDQAWLRDLLMEPD